MEKSKPDPKPAKPGYIVINLTRGAIDGVYTPDDPELTAQAVAYWREQFPGDLIVAAKLVEWPDLPDRFFARGEVRWMNEIDDRPGLQRQPGG